MKFTELYYGDAQRLAVYLAARNCEQITLANGSSEGFPMPPKTKKLPHSIDYFEIGRDMVAYLSKDGEDVKYKDRNLRRIVFGERLRGVRKKKGMTLEELEYKTGIKARNLESIENGRYDASIDVVSNICEALDVTIAFIDKK